MNDRPSPFDVQALESRRFLSVTLAGDVLRVVELGTKRDTIRAVQEKGQIVVTVNGREKRFDASGVDQLVVESGAGNDRVTLKGLRPRTKVYGGSGKDTIVGGRADDLLFGEEGQDRIAGGPGDDFLNGGGGEDLLEGNTGDDHLEGHAENDTLRGGAGDDRLDAVDYLWEDIVDGGAGNDVGIIDDGIPDPEDFDTEEDDVLGLEDIREIDNPYLDD